MDNSRRPRNRRAFLPRRRQPTGIGALRRAINATTPYRIRDNVHNMVTPPSHNFGIKIRKFFRFPLQLGGTPANVTVGNVATAVFADAGFAAPTNYNIAIHGCRIFGVPPSGTATNPTLNVDLEAKVFDIENAGPNNMVANFNDRSSAAGIAHILFKFPVNDRPTFSASTVGTTQFMQLVGTNTAEILLDFDATLTCRPPNSFLMLHSDEPAVNAMELSPLRFLSLSARPGDVPEVEE